MVTKIQDASLLFKRLDIDKTIKIKTNSNIYNNDIDFNNLENIKKSWLYPSLLSFKEYLKLYPKPDSFAVIGTGNGLDAIGAQEIFNQNTTYLTDIFQSISDVAKDNFISNLPNKKCDAFYGDLCYPLIENNIKVDLIYTNLPNLPSNEDLTKEIKSATFFNSKNSNCPKELKKYLLENQYNFLMSAKNALNDNGKVIIALGGRIPYSKIRELFEISGYKLRKLLTYFKEQTELEEVLEGYAKYETKRIKFYFYDLNTKKKYSATHALEKYNKDKTSKFGIYVHLLLGIKR